MEQEKNPAAAGPEPMKGGFVARIVEVFLKGNFSGLLIIMALLAGTIAVLVTPREEEPQIVVPLANVFVQVPGASAHEVERLVSTKLEKLLYQIDGVEYVYSMSRPGMAIVTVRYYVGEDRTASLVKLYNKISMHMDEIPPIVKGWVVKPVEIDDVPIVDITFASDRLTDFELRRIAEEVEIRLQSVKNTGMTYIVGGAPLQVKVLLNIERLASRGLSAAQVIQAIQAADMKLQAGSFTEGNREAFLEAGEFLKTPQEVGDLIVGLHKGSPIYLRDVAQVEEAPADVVSYCEFGLGPSADKRFPVPPGLEGARRKNYTAVTLAVAKKKGTNAVWVSEAIQERLKKIQEEVIPEGVYTWITRDYGETANDKVNDLLEGLAIAILIVIAMISIIMGWHSGMVVATAVPITFGFTLIINYLMGYTINRVTLFALTLSLGLIVDDPIVGVENIYRHLKMAIRGPVESVLYAMGEVLPPIILATFAVMVSFLPLFFITGMMGPYMAPMALNVPMAMLVSMIVSFTVTPWLSYHVLKGRIKDAGKPEDRDITQTRIYRIYQRFLGPFLRRRTFAWSMYLVLLVLFVASSSLALLRYVPLKMLPFDNKNEFQLVIDMPEGTTLETTQAVCEELSDYLRTVPEVTDFSTFCGTASPMDFNGLVRFYYLRRGSNVADIRVNMIHKKQRVQQSHAICLRIRRDIEKIQDKYPGASIKIVEFPPGPPVLSTINVEVYGGPFTRYSDLIRGAKILEKRLRKERGVVDIDDFVEAPQEKVVFVPDKEKAALSGVSDEAIARTVAAAFGGVRADILHRPGEVEPMAIQIQLPLADKSREEELASVYVPSRLGVMVPLLELGRVERRLEDKTIYHKNLKRVVYVVAEMAGRAPGEAILDIQSDIGTKVKMPPGVTLEWAGEGEWKITLDVFRDLGIAFGIALLGIYVLLVGQTKSYFMPLVLMISIPLTVIGIMPGFWLLNHIATHPVGGYPNPIFFTATAMIGMIGISGLAVRNAILLIDFIQEALARGETFREAILKSGAVRTRPILLTSGAAILGAVPITLDPIFSGLAWAFIFGLIVSTAFTLFVVPTAYFMVSGGFRKEKA